MKYILTLFFVFCSMMVFAQNNYLIPHQEQMMDSIEAAQHKYRQDSLQIVARAAAELGVLRENLSNEMVREKELYTSSVLKTFTSSAELKNVESFLIAFMSQYNDPQQYLSLKEEILKINRQLEGRDNETFVQFNQFVEELDVLENSLFILNHISAKNVVAENISAINRAKFYTPEQIESIEPVIASLKNYSSAMIYIRAMLSTIKSSYDLYVDSGQTQKPSEAIEDELTFEIGISKILSVPCIKNIYQRVVDDVLAYNDDESLNFEKFNVYLLEELIKELE